MIINCVANHWERQPLTTAPVSFSENMNKGSSIANNLHNLSIKLKAIFITGSNTMMDIYL